MPPAAAQGQAGAQRRGSPADLGQGPWQKTCKGVIARRSRIEIGCGARRPSSERAPPRASAIEGLRCALRIAGGRRPRLRRGRRTQDAKSAPCRDPRVIRQGRSSQIQTRGQRATPRGRRELHVAATPPARRPVQSNAAKQKTRASCHRSGSLQERQTRPVAETRVFNRGPAAVGGVWVGWAATFDNLYFK